MKKSVFLILLFFISANLFAMKRSREEEQGVEPAKCARHAVIAPLYYEPLEKIFNQASYDDWTPQGNLGVNLRKSTSIVAEYPGGIYDLEVRNATHANSLLFNMYEALKDTKNALVRITFSGPCLDRSIALPALDTVIIGNDFTGSTFFLGSRRAPNNSHYIFKDKLVSPIKIVANGKVAAARPTDFEIYPDSPTKIINLLHNSKHDQFIEEHTDGQNNISYSDNHNIPARKHQIDQIYQYIQARKKNIKYMTFNAATGSGKSYTMQRIAELGGKTLIVTSRLNLVDQLYESFRQHFSQLKVANSTKQRALAKFLPHAIQNNDVVIVTLQAFQRNYKTENLLHNIDIIMFDEAHNLFSKEQKLMIDALKDKHSFEILFFTATPTMLRRHKSGLISVYELSGEPIKGKKQHHIKDIKLKDAIDLGVNAPFQIVHVRGLESLNFKKSGEDYDNTEIARELSQDKHHRVVLDFYLNAEIHSETDSMPIKNKYGMAFCAGIAQAESLKSYLNNNFPRGIKDHKNAYEAALKNYIFSSEKDSPIKLKKLYKAIGSDIKNYHERVFSIRDLENLHSSFLKLYPYVFADTVHSGNEMHNVSEVDTDLRLLRNKLGGSTILCGAEKLNEGYDNPLVEVGLNLSPVRFSNLKSLQRFGRLGRTNRENPNKIAIVAEFIWDNSQLLLSSTNLLNCMNYGLKEKVNISIKEHLADTISYKIDTELILQGAIPKRAKDSPIQRVKANPGVVNLASRTSHLSDEALLVDLEIIIGRLKKAYAQLANYELQAQEYDEAVEEEKAPMGMPSLEPTALAKYLQRSELAKQSSITAIDHALFNEAERAILEVKKFFEHGNHERPLKSGSKNSDSTSLLKKPSEDLLTQRELLVRLRDRANRAINAANSFMTGCQMGDLEEEIRSILAELNYLGQNHRQARAQIATTPVTYNVTPIIPTTVKEASASQEEINGILSDVSQLPTFSIGAVDFSTFVAIIQKLSFGSKLKNLDFIETDSRDYIRVWHFLQMLNETSNFPALVHVRMRLKNSSNFTLASASLELPAGWIYDAARDQNDTVIQLSKITISQSLPVAPLSIIQEIKRPEEPKRKPAVNPHFTYDIELLSFVHNPYEIEGTLTLGQFIQPSNVTSLATIISQYPEFFNKISALHIVMPKSVAALQITIAMISQFNNLKNLMLLGVQPMHLDFLIYTISNNKLDHLHIIDFKLDLSSGSDFRHNCSINRLDVFSKFRNLSWIVEERNSNSWSDFILFSPHYMRAKESGLEHVYSAEFNRITNYALLHPGYWFDISVMKPNLSVLWFTDIINPHFKDYVQSYDISYSFYLYLAKETKKALLTEIIPGATENNIFFIRILNFFDSNFAIQSDEIFDALLLDDERRWVGQPILEQYYIKNPQGKIADYINRIPSRFNTVAQ